MSEDSPWVSEGIAWLRVQLSSLSADTAEISRYADAIYGIILDLRVRAKSSSHKIGRSAANTYFAKPRKPVPSPVKQLSAMALAARSGSLEKWLKSWARASPEVRNAVWRQLERPFRWVNFTASPPQFFVIDGPSACDAVPAIDRAIAALEAIPVQERRRKKTDELKRALEIKLREAVKSLTGAKGITFDPYAEDRQKYKGPLIELGRAIDERFGTSVEKRLKRPAIR